MLRNPIITAILALASVFVATKLVVSSFGVTFDSEIAAAMTFGAFVLWVLLKRALRQRRNTQELEAAKQRDAVKNAEFDAAYAAAKLNGDFDQFGWQK